MISRMREIAHLNSLAWVPECAHAIGTVRLLPSIKLLINGGMTSAQSQIGNNCENFHQICWITQPSPYKLKKQYFILTRKSHQGTYSLGSLTLLLNISILKYRYTFNQHLSEVCHVYFLVERKKESLLLFQEVTNIIKYYCFYPYIISTCWIWILQSIKFFVLTNHTVNLWLQYISWDARSP